MTNDAESDGLPPVPRRAASLLAAFPGVQSLHVSTCSSFTPEKSAQNPWQQMLRLFGNDPLVADEFKLFLDPLAAVGADPDLEPARLDPLGQIPPGIEQICRAKLEGNRLRLARV